MALVTIDRSADRLLPTPASSARPTLVLDRLAARLAALTDDDTAVITAWSAVVAIEAHLGISLGDADDGVAPLWRRFARVDRHLRHLPPADHHGSEAVRIAVALLTTLR